MKKHYLSQNIIDANHKILIDLVGCGGTGSHMLSNLAMINKAMISLGRRSISLRVWDPDIVSSHNVGRQLFSASDIDKNKGSVLVSRINKFYGFGWLSMNTKYNPGHGADIIISCVDSVKSRREISNSIYDSRNKKPFYWMDIGNGPDFGQCILGTVQDISQPNKKDKRHLPNIFDEHYDIESKEDPDMPSCSVAESLSKQGLFTNKLMATHAAELIWTLLNQYYITYRGFYLNLSTMNLSVIPI